MKRADNFKKNKEGYLQENREELKGNAGVRSISSTSQNEENDVNEYPEGMLEKILNSQNLNLATKRVKANKGSHGVVLETEEGTPQGGNLSPLLSNIMLNELDKELTNRGLKFCRYADDCNIYVRSRKAAERVMAGITKFIEEKLKLKVNKAKSSVTSRLRIWVDLQDYWINGSEEE